MQYYSNTLMEILTSKEIHKKREYRKKTYVLMEKRPFKPFGIQNVIDRQT